MISNAQSAPAATYEISRCTFDGGAMNVSGGSYSLSCGAYTLAGGFWGGAVANYNVYLPLLLKNS